MGVEVASLSEIRDVDILNFGLLGQLIKIGKSMALVFEGESQGKEKKSGKGELHSDFRVLKAA